MADLRALKDKAADLAARGKLDKAAESYRSVLQADPRDTATRQRFAEVLRRAARLDEAVDAYAVVAEEYATQGLLAKAIGICKTLLELEPEHHETQARLAELYAARARDGGTRLTMAAMPAVVMPSSAPAPAPDVPPDERNVAIPLARGKGAIALGPSAPALSATETPLAQILSAAQAASAAGVEEDVVLDLDDEPLEIATYESPPPAGGRWAQAPEADERAEEEAEPAGRADEPIVVLAPEAADAPVVLDGTPVEEAVEEASAAGETGEAAAGDEDELEEPDEVSDDAILEAAPEPRAPSARRGAPMPVDLALPRVPLFSDLSREAFIALTEAMALQRARAGEAVLHEGDDGTSFYVVAGGALVVSKRDDRGELVKLARLSEGDFFGEMAILSGAPRLATVTAETDVEILEISAEVLLELVRRHPHVATSLRRFYRQRLLANAMAVSPVFQPFSREERRAVMARFRSREVQAGEVIVTEGTPSDGLYVVLDGAFEVTRRQGAGPVTVAELREADLFGEMSCLRKAPATATVTARRAGTLLRLPRDGFDELVMSHPQVLEVVAELSEERAGNLDAILTGHAQWTEEGLVLV
jgi:CRP-like cAMP-binding protein